MDNFITLNYMGTFVGMVAIVVLLTQFTKDLIDKVAKWLPTKYVVFAYALIVIFGYQAMSGTFDGTKILLTIINAILLTMTAQGGYEWLYKPIEIKYADKNTNTIIAPKELPQDTDAKENYDTKPKSENVTAEIPQTTENNIVQ